MMLVMALSLMPNCVARVAGVAVTDKTFYDPIRTASSYCEEKYRPD